MVSRDGRRGAGKPTEENLQSSVPECTPERFRAPEYAVFPLKRFVSLITVIGLMVIAMIVYSAKTGLRMSQHYTPLIDAAMEIKQEATIGHLWFEEILADDRNESIETVRAHLKQADWYAQAMLEGGQNSEGIFIPLNDPELRGYIQNVRIELAQFYTHMEHRWRNHQTSGPGSDVDQSFDQIFKSLIAKADIVETRLQVLIKQAEERFVVIQIVLALLTLCVMAVLGGLFLRFANIQNQSLCALQAEIASRKDVEHTLRKQATTDTLTGLINRRRMGVMLQDELNRAQRLNTPFSIILFDIDHFKMVNDTHGHKIGDDVLKFIAITVKSRLRELDALARWGGEEFLILLPGTPLDGALALSKTCHEILNVSQIPDVGKVTASFGVAEHHADEDIRALIHRADEALYEAKHNGRNRIEVSVAENVI